MNVGSPPPQLRTRVLALEAEGENSEKHLLGAQMLILGLMTAFSGNDG